MCPHTKNSLHVLFSLHLSAAVCLSHILQYFVVVMCTLSVVRWQGLFQFCLIFLSLPCHFNSMCGKSQIQTVFLSPFTHILQVNFPLFDLEDVSPFMMVFVYAADLLLRLRAMPLSGHLLLTLDVSRVALELYCVLRGRGFFVVETCFSRFKMGGGKAVEYLAKPGP